MTALPPKNSQEPDESLWHFDDMPDQRYPARDVSRSSNTAFDTVQDPDRFNRLGAFNFSVSGLSDAELAQIGNGNPVAGAQRISHENLMGVLRDRAQTDIDREKKASSILFLPREFSGYVWDRVRNVELGRLASDLLRLRRPTRIIRENRARILSSAPLPVDLDRTVREADRRQRLSDQEYDINALQHALETLPIPDPPDLADEFKNYLELVKSRVKIGEANAGNPDYLALLRLLVSDSSALELFKNRIIKEREKKPEHQKNNGEKYEGYLKALEEWEKARLQYDKINGALQRSVLFYDNINKRLNPPPPPPSPLPERERVTLSQQLGQLSNKISDLGAEQTEILSKLSNLRSDLPPTEGDHDIHASLDTILDAEILVGSPPPAALTTALKELKTVKGIFSKKRDKAKSHAPSAESEKKDDRFTAHQLLYLVVQDTMKRRGITDAFDIKLSVNIARAHAETAMYADTNKKWHDRFLHHHQPFGLSFKAVMKRLSHFQEFRALEKFARNPAANRIKFSEVQALSMDKDLLRHLSSVLQQILKGPNGKEGEPHVEIRREDAPHLQKLIELIQQAWAIKDANEFTKSWNKRRLLNQIPQDIPEEQFIVNLLEEQRMRSDRRRDELSTQYDSARELKWPELFERGKIFQWYLDRREDIKKLPKKEREELLRDLGMKDASFLTRRRMPVSYGYRKAKEFLKEKPSRLLYYGPIAPWLLKETVGDGSRWLYKKRKEHKAKKREAIANALKSGKKPPRSLLRKIVGFPIDFLKTAGETPGLALFPPKKRAAAH